MKILFITDFGLHHTIGGAQRSNDIIVKEGLKRGHDITYFHYDSNPNILFGQKFDIVITSNMETISKHMAFPYIINSLIQNNKHIRIEHDLCKYLSIENRITLFQSCNIAFFLTTYHYQKFIDFYGNIFVNVKIIPDPIDKHEFYDYNKEREDAILYSSYMHYLKGTLNFIEYVKANPNLKFYTSCWGEMAFEQEIRKYSNITVLKPVDHSLVPQLFNRFKYLYYNPITDEPFCRTVGEATMCGMQLLGNKEKIGCLYFLQECNNDIKIFSDKCHDAPIDMWNTIEKI